MARRVLVFVLVLALTASTWTSYAARQEPRSQDQRQRISRLSATQRQALESYGREVEIELDDQDVPSNLMGTLSQRASEEPLLAARAALDLHGTAFRRGPEDGFAYRTHETDELGMTHIRMTQTYRGLPVVGGELIVHLTEENVAGINGRFVADLDLATQPAITADQAAASALSFIANQGGQNANVTEQAEPVVWIDGKNRGHLALPVQVEYEGPEGVEHDKLFVDAGDGQVLDRRPLIRRAKHRKIYDAQNKTDLPGKFLFEESGSSSDAVAMNAYNHSGTAYDFYKSVFGRDSYDNAGAVIISSVHYGNKENNAYWYRSQMLFGDGDGVKFNSWANGLDIVAHEFTHGVTEKTADLIYSGESGALNEASSDILGESAAFWAGQGDWEIGAQIYRPVAHLALRYMYDPARDAAQSNIASSDYYPTRYTGTDDNGGVHINSGIANLFFYLLSEGGTHPRGKTTIAVPGIGIEKARAIWYRALTYYMTPTTNFQSARAATVRAAFDLYVRCRPGIPCAPALEPVAVHAAWDAVGAPGSHLWTTYAQLLRNPGFESGAVYWAATPGVIISSPAEPPHSGSWDARLNGRGTTHTDTLAQTVTIPSTSNAALSFWLRVDTAETTTSTAYDTLKVQILNSGGAVLATLATYSNLNRADGYSPKSFDLTPYRGQTIQLRFVSAEDYSLKTSFVIDDAAVTVWTLPPSPSFP
jgi:vibriolysin